MAWEMFADRLTRPDGEVVYLYASPHRRYVEAHGMRSIVAGSVAEDEAGAYWGWVSAPDRR